VTQLTQACLQAEELEAARRALLETELASRRAATEQQMELAVASEKLKLAEILAQEKEVSRDTSHSLPNPL